MNTLLRRCLPLFLAPLAFGQGSQLPKYTVATLPNASAQITYTVQVIDGTTNTDCVIGGASGHSAFNVVCSVRWNGSAYVWAPANTTAGGGGTTTNALTANSSGGASPGDTFNGSAAKTWDYHTFGAQQALTLTTTGTSGAATLSGGALNIPQYSAGGGSGVQYNPTTTSYIVTSTSGWYDDNDSNSTNLGVPSSVSCTGSGPTTCTVVTATPHGLAVGGAIDMSPLSSWPGGVYQAAQYGSFQVDTVPTTTSLTFTTPRSITYSCSPCTGNVYDASYWGIWRFAAEPFIYGHGTVYGIETTTANLDTNFTSLTSGLTGTPTFLIDNTGVNDFAGGATPAQVNTSHQNVWAKAHTAGMLVVQTTIAPAQYGLAGEDVKPGQLNTLLYPQSKTASLAATGKYYDRWSDVASALNLWGDNTAVLPDQAAAAKAADKLNEAFSTQKSSYVAPPTNFTFSVSGLGGNGVPGDYVGNRRLFFYNNGGTWTSFMDWNTGTVRLSLLLNQPCLGTDGNGTIGTGTCGGISGMTAGQVPIAATASTITSSKALAGIGTGIVTGPTTSTVGDLLTYSGTDGTTQDSGTLLSSLAPKASPVFTGTPDASGATQFKLPVAASFASLANGELGYDSTDLNWHVWSNAADQFMATFPVSTPPTSGNCVEFSKIGNSWKLIDAGGPCGISGGGVTAFSGDGVLLNNSSSTGSVTATLANAGAYTVWGNNTGSTAAPGYQSLSSPQIPAVAVTIDTSTPVSVTSTNKATFHFNQNATAATAVTYNLPTAAAGIQKCFSNSYNGSAPDTGIITIATSASGQFIIFTDGTLSATGGNVTSGGAASDAACVVGVDSTHWQLYVQRGTWTKH